MPSLNQELTPAAKHAVMEACHARPRMITRADVLAIGRQTASLDRSDRPPYPVDPAHGVNSERGIVLASDAVVCPPGRLDHARDVRCPQNGARFNGNCTPTVGKSVPVSRLTRLHDTVNSSDISVEFTVTNQAAWR